MASDNTDCSIRDQSMEDIFQGRYSCESDKCMNSFSTGKRKKKQGRKKYFTLKRQ